jgi:hypothetical protein
MVTTTPADIPGDPINIGLVASKNEVLSAFARSAWRPADAITLESSVEIGLSVLLREPYPNAPVSVLLFEGRVQDLAFEKTIGGSADQRHHVRLWRALNVGAEGRPVWLGTASLDRSVGISYYTGQITHHIAPDLDAERDMIMRQFEAAGVLLSTHLVSGIGPTTAGRNGGGDPYHTDGDVVIGVIAPDTEPQPDRVVVAAPVPISTAAKQQAWRFIRWLGVLDRLTKHPTRRESRNS